MPGKSLTRPPRMSTTECSCRLCPMPGMYAVTSTPLVRRTRATLRKAEFGFFGVMVRTWVQTPRFWGAPPIGNCLSRKELYDTLMAGALLFTDTFLRPLRTSWLIVGIKKYLPFLPSILRRADHLQYARRPAGTR